MNYESILYKLALKAYKHDEIPVSCIIVRNNKIIAKAYNKKNKTGNVLDHAEIIAIRKASKKLLTWNLSDCEIYCSLKPCRMCEEVIKQSYIKKVYYYLDNSKIINYKYNSEQLYVHNDKNNFEKLLKDFFINKR